MYIYNMLYTCIGICLALHEYTVLLCVAYLLLTYISLCTKVIFKEFLLHVYQWYSTSCNMLRKQGCDVWILVYAFL